MKFKPNEVQELLKASYEKNKYDIDKFKIDSSLSGNRVKVYTVDNSKDVIVTHRGSGNAQDWFDNAVWFKFNSLTLSKTYKMHLKKHKEAVKKYNAKNIIVMGHSRGGLYAKEIYDNKLVKQLITYNKPVNMYDIISNNVKSKKNDKNETVIRTSGDVVSSGQNFLKGNSSDVVIDSKTINPLTEHNTDQLGNLKDDKLIGQGIFKRKIDFSKLRKSELKDFVKQNKKKLNLDINITGLTKKDYIIIIEQLLN